MRPFIASVAVIFSVNFTDPHILGVKYLNYDDVIKQSLKLLKLEVCYLNAQESQYFTLC
jgi:hypothetical protein